jgi:hypothetical protein
MIKWEEFAAFMDIGELEHVCYLIGLAEKENWEDLDELIGENSHLQMKLNAQDKHSSAILEGERPGLYPKTWIAHLFVALYVLLDELTEKPRRLTDALPRLVLDLHKVVIAGHDVFDSHHRAALVAKALLDGEAKAKSERSQKSRESVKARSDQVMKAAFTEWAKSSLSLGLSADTVDDLQALKGFNPAWSGVAVKTLKAWSRAAGFTFKTGRPKKNK